MNNYEEICANIKEAVEKKNDYVVITFNDNNAQYYASVEDDNLIPVFLAHVADEVAKTLPLYQGEGALTPQEINKIVSSDEVTPVAPATKKTTKKGTGTRKPRAKKVAE